MNIESDPNLIKEITAVNYDCNKISYSNSCRRAYSAQASLLDNFVGEVSYRQKMFIGLGCGTAG